MSQDDIIWTSCLPSLETMGVTCSFDLPSGKSVLLTLWTFKGKIVAHAVNMSTGLVVFPCFCARDDGAMLENQALRYGEPLRKELLH